MDFKECLELLRMLVEKHSISETYICGGVARDTFIAKHSGQPLKAINDVDLANGDNTIHQLAKEFAIALRNKNINVIEKQANDGHSSIIVDKLKFDFSSNFVSKRLKLEGDPLYKEVISRDFTCNSLLLTLDLKQILDLTGKGEQDIIAKKIVCCADPSITLADNTNRIVRALYLSCKLGFEIDQSIISFIQEHGDYLKYSKVAYVSKVLKEAYTYNSDKLIELLDQCDLWKEIPIIPELEQVYLKEKIIKQSQFFTNFDYGIDSKTGPGLSPYSLKDKYKSISEFRKKYWNKRKKKVWKGIKDSKPK